MSSKTTIDAAGRVVLPKAMRDNLQLQPGDWLTLEDNETEIVIRPLRASTGMQKKLGIWTFGSGEPLSLEEANQVVREVRRERDRTLLGSSAARGSIRPAKRAKA